MLVFLGAVCQLPNEWLPNDNCGSALRFTGGMAQCEVLECQNG